ncbi:MAG: (d)CMP kinase [Fusobacteriaceae bacterium]
MKNYESSIIIAIDGPAGSGKSTIAKILAEKYGLVYLDTGAMYRMVAYYSLKNNIDLDNSDKVSDMLSKIVLDINEGGFFVNGKNISEEIRTPEVTNIVSKVAALKEVRDKLVGLQREIAKNKKSVLDGRDIGTVVFPKADLKIFLVASPEERAKRRVKDYQSKGITGESFEEVLDAIKNRDLLDSTRKESPLKKADDAIEIDTSNMNIQEVCTEISKYINKLNI